MKNLQDMVNSLLYKATLARNSRDALRYAQAALNAANTKQTRTNSKSEKSEEKQSPAKSKPGKSKK